MKRKYVIIFILLILTFCGCSHNTSAGLSSKPIIAVSIVPEETFLKNIAGDLVEIVTLIPPGNSPANYAPTPQELEKLSRAKIYYTIGVPTETANILPKVKELNNKMKIVDLPKIVSEIYPDREFSPGHRDPHIWLSPKRVKIIVSAMTKELIAIDPNNKDIYEQNAEKYLHELDILNQDIQSSLENTKSKSFIIYHPSLGYFADDYNLKMISIENEGKTATSKDLKNIIDLAKEKNVKVIFHQKEIDSKKVQTLVKEIGGATMEIQPLSANYIENLKSMANTLENALN
ncbi:zinc transport system substrate-binding protein [Desulfonispora thiosulfatigenes DSM 11270]|uniref:Zinc transport system substrate-binding protein n=1 Tax=Desulfonispora thiosulfatigenes DSM 11270 TaxID=656914 RepID=A0A1W1VT53_DESTI|nr:zinc ABC transporter substrate-binding protein [Desulfonispora thiosulfatigenes]SMB96552.1 zinc transport system substrate-binding protein [Desulfonispora thiosulfatigenes DSM 11270]